MMSNIPRPTYLRDYKPSSFLVKSVHLTFTLSPKNTKVFARIMFSPTNDYDDLKLDGIDLTLTKLSIDGVRQKLDSLIFKPDRLIAPTEIIPKRDFCWEAETIISPELNTSLDGLYRSSGTFCTQCEAQGFRKITYFLDRPDVMAPYTVRIEGDDPVLLSNGNLIKSGPGYAEWHDPWPKPSYLFALVAGDLVSYDDNFTTRSGQLVELKIFVKSEDIYKCSYAMDALKRSMKWDENVYQREYDLKLFMIVAIDDFNMGAMENKGLNIFNSKYILADPKTATDTDYDNIERIIAHEYFHNWTGNRITCRDWFQLCLKEGLTVFRDQQFSAEMRGFSIKRIEDVLTLQNRQFREDDSPLSHPVRPEKYMEINNFYTATVYEKGAELVRMLKLIVGSTNYDRALQQYFSHYDGQACTVEDWLHIFEKTSQINLKQFSLWYSQKGRPRVTVQSSFDDGTFTMNFKQEPGIERNKLAKPMLIPITIGLLDRHGIEIRKSCTVLVSQKEQSIKFDGLPSKPIPSTLRDFSAPVTLIETMSNHDLKILAQYDPNLFNRWNALRKLSFQAIARLIYDNIPIPDDLLSIIESAIMSEELGHAYRALIATPPSAHNLLNFCSMLNKPIDPFQIHNAINSFNKTLAQKCRIFITNYLGEAKPYPEYAPTPEQAGFRAFTLKLLDLYCYCSSDVANVKRFHETASNMTDEISSLILLIKHDKITGELKNFYEKWRSNDNVINKWFAAQATYTTPKKAVQVVSKLTKHDFFDFKNPNRFKSVIETFASANLLGFHQSDGQGYDLVTDWLIKLDGINPQTTARVCTVFDNWKLFDSDRQTKIEQNLLKLLTMKSVSKNTYEIVNTLLKK